MTSLRFARQISDLNAGRASQNFGLFDSAFVKQIVVCLISFRLAALRAFGDISEAPARSTKRICEINGSLLIERATDRDLVVINSAPQRREKGAMVTKHILSKIVFVVLVAFLAAIAIGLPAQSAPIFTLLHSFDITSGEQPDAGLVQGTDGHFYGTTYYGGAYDHGTVFKIATGGILTTLHSFDQADGESPDAGLIQGLDGNFYGTTHIGGRILPTALSSKSALAVR
jgi:uncharacterized repeat protein (TIGR03803 family)